MTTSMTTVTRVQIQAALAEHGLRLRGGWVPDPSDALPPLPHGQNAAVVWMVGMAGSECWPQFSTSRFFSDGRPNPMDRWSASIAAGLAQRWLGLAIFPFEGPPYYPFQQWASRAEALQPSPLMLRLHPEFGVWHAYRFALALPQLQDGDLAAPQATLQSSRTDICLRCDGKPCLSACPVQAFSGQSFAVDACRSHLRGPLGAQCVQGGCLARNACPEGADYRYQSAHAAFHMQAFLRPQAEV